MGGRKTAAVKNSAISFVGQLISLVLQIISRKVFIQYIGEEILGLNGTFTSILSTLSLAELGFQNATAYNLYRPLREGNKQEINDVMNVYKVIYRIVGCVFIVGTLLLLPCLRLFLKDITITKDVRIYFILQAFSSTCTYFFAYKRTIFYADQKEYICKAIDIVLIIITKMAQIFAIVKYQSYYMYIILQVIQVYAGNIIIHLLGKKKFPYLQKQKFNKSCAKKVFNDAKEIFTGRIAGVVYSSTDNLIVSKTIGTVSVAYLGNYTSVTTNIRYLIYSIMLPLAPFIGNYLAGNDSVEQQEKKLYIYTHLRCFFAAVILIPTYVLIDDFIIWWLGEKFVMHGAVKLLLIADLYLILLRGACEDYINGKGLFRQAKYVTIISTVMNLGLSLMLVGVWGIAGVLVGTVFSQMVLCIGNCIIVYKCYFKTGKGLHYMAKNIYYILCFVVIAFVCQFVYGFIRMESVFGRLILGGIASEVIILLLYLLLHGSDKAHREICQMFVQAIKGRVKNR